MKDFVSARWIRLIGLVVSTSVVWAIFRIHDFPWTGLVWASLAFSTALWVHTRSNRSTQIDDIETEPLRVAIVARKMPVL